ncbi:hypothetical protein I549_4443 [Mycobacterium avium subsp. avium 2285 (R)]|nr:hypothetical protein I549_4443 [Mycobacterium avium subsp. avium 2285 (R)]
MLHATLLRRASGFAAPLSWARFCVGVTTTSAVQEQVGIKSRNKKCRLWIHSAGDK